MKLSAYWVSFNRKHGNHLRSQIDDKSVLMQYPLVISHNGEANMGDILQSLKVSAVTVSVSYGGAIPAACLVVLRVVGCLPSE